MLEQGYQWVYAAFYFDLLIILMIRAFQMNNQTVINDHGLIKTKSFSKLLAVVFIAPLAFIAGSRTSFIDTGDYIEMYKLVGSDLKNIDFSKFASNIEKGYLYFTCVLNKISSDPQLLFFVSSIIICSFFVVFVYSNCEDVPFGLLIFLCRMWTDSMNGLRQCLVAAILCYAWTIWAKSGRKVKNDIIFALFILLLATLHKSVLICLVVFLISRGNFLNIGTKIVIVATLVIFFIPGAYSLIFENMFFDDYANYENDNGTMGIMRFCVNAVPFVLILILKLIEKDKLSFSDDINNWMMNICLFDFCCSVLALKMVFFARLSIYFGIFNAVMIPNLVHRIFKTKSSLIFVKIFAFSLYLIFFLYQMDAYGGYMQNIGLFFLDQ